MAIFFGIGTALQLFSENTLERKGHELTGTYRDIHIPIFYPSSLRTDEAKENRIESYTSVLLNPSSRITRDKKQVPKVERRYNGRVLKASLRFTRG